MTTCPNARSLFAPRLTAETIGKDTAEHTPMEAHAKSPDQAASEPSWQAGVVDLPRSCCLAAAPGSCSRSGDEHAGPRRGSHQSAVREASPQPECIGRGRGPAMAYGEPELTWTPCPACGCPDLFTAVARPGEREQPLYLPVAGAGGSGTTSPISTATCRQRRPCLPVFRNIAIPLRRSRTVASS